MLNVIGFHKPDEINGYLSNWYLSEFIAEGVNSPPPVEQCHQLKKKRIKHILSLILFYTLKFNHLEKRY